MWQHFAKSAQQVRIEYVVKAHVKVPYNKSVKVTKMLSVGTLQTDRNISKHYKGFVNVTLLFIGSVVQPKGTEIKDFEVSKSSKWDRAMNLNKDSRFTLRVWPIRNNCIKGRTC